VTRLDRGYALAQVRLQARHGLRPAAPDWAALEATGDLDAALGLLVDWPAARWTRRLGRHPAVREVERRAREGWLEEVAEVARWLPERDRALVLWLGWLPWLPALQKLARGGRAPDWARDDAVLGPVVASDPTGRTAALARTALAPLAAHLTGGADPASAWFEHWRALWPAGGPARRSLERLSGDVRQALARLAALPPGSRSEPTFADLRHRFEVAFRRHPLAPAGTVAWLGLRGLVLRQLRGALVVRALAQPAVAA
jgi:hypothetical protein